MWLRRWPIAIIAAVIVLLIACCFVFLPRDAGLTELDQSIVCFHAYNDATGDNFFSKWEAKLYLKVMLKGDPSTIRFYQNKKNINPEGAYYWYQKDMSSAIMAVSQGFDETGYGLLLQTLEKKQKYPEILTSAAEQIRWYASAKNYIVTKFGKEKAIASLKKCIHNKDVNVRVEAAGALLMLGDGDSALPVLDSIIKEGIPESREAVECLFKWDWVYQEGMIGRGLSLKLLDERGLEILKRTLNYTYYK